MTAGILHVRNAPEETFSAVRVGLADGQSPAAAAPPDAAPPVSNGQAARPGPGPISLSDLVKEVKSRSSTTTTRPRASTTTTKKPAIATPTSTTTTTTTTAAAIRPPATTTTTVAPGTPLTTLLEKVVPPAAAVTGMLTRSDSGIASWFRAGAGTCAHRTLAMGTVIKVTRLHNGATATCKVDDRGPTVETGRLIDLSLDVFEKLAAREAGLIHVKIEW